MIKVSFYIRERKHKQGTVYVKFYVQRKIVNFSTGVGCEPENWDADKMFVTKKDKDHASKNLIIENIRARIVRVFVNYELRSRLLTRDLFYKAYNRPDDYPTFFNYIRAYQRRTRSSLEYNTVKLHNSVIKKLESFNPDLHFDDLNIVFLNNFQNYLRREFGNKQTTVHKNMGVLKKYIRAAVREGYLELNPFDDFRLQQGRPNIVFLDENELTDFVQLYQSAQYEPRHLTTLRCFLYLCFSSQHIGDARTMRIEHFQNSHFTYYRIKNRNSKPEEVSVPISAPLAKLVEDIAGGRNKGRLFDKLPADQTMNRYLKVMASQIGISKDISLKAGRHTFATYFLQHNHNPRVLQEILGHSDIKTTMIYVHVMDKYKTEGVQCFDHFEL